MSKKTFAYVSSWSHGQASSGLWLHEYDEETGVLTPIKQIDDKTDFAVSTIDRDRKVLYILDESGDLPGFRVSGGGRAFAYRIDPETGDLQQISCVPTWCPNPSYVTMDKTGKYLLVSNHAGRACATKIVRDAYGNLSLHLEFDDSTVDLFELKEDGSIGRMLDAVKHEGSGPDPKFQNNPHPHCVVMSPCGKFFAVCDKGNDGVYLYTIDREKGRLVPTGPAFACPPGSRPRFAAFHPVLPVVYHNNEGRAEVDAYRYDEHGHLTHLGSYDVRKEENLSIPSKWEQQDFRVNSTGRYLYSLVAAPAAVIVYEINQTTGELQLIQNLFLDGERARACALSPDEKFLLVACAASGKIVTLAVGEDGMLTDTGIVTEQPNAAFITFYQS